MSKLFRTFKIRRILISNNQNKNHPTEFQPLPYLCLTDADDKKEEES